MTDKRLITTKHDETVCQYSKQGNNQTFLLTCCKWLICVTITTKT